MMGYEILFPIFALVVAEAGLADDSKFSSNSALSRSSQSIEERGDTSSSVLEKRKMDFRAPPQYNIIEGEPLNEEDFRRAESIKDDEVAFPRPDPTEDSGYFEGDILQDLEDRNAVRNTRALWPKGIIPYAISRDYDDRGRSIIAKAMKEYHDKTCIKFVPRTDETDYLYISPDGGCASFVGRTGGAQGISLGRGCYLTGVVIHELMHATGFMHEQNREDRDEHIDIQWDNIVSGRQINFQKFSWKEIQNLGEKYDYGSVLHYDQYAFAKDPSKPTIIPKKKDAVIGQRIGFSETDLRKLNKLYKCNSKGKNAPGSCKDESKVCNILVRHGMCQRDPVGMEDKCRKSCSFC